LANLHFKEQRGTNAYGVFSPREVTACYAIALYKVERLSVPYERSLTGFFYSLIAVRYGMVTHCAEAGPRFLFYRSTIIHGEEQTTSAWFH